MCGAMALISRQTLAIGIVLATLLVGAFGQTGPSPTFDPFGGKADSYHFDLRRNFFASPEVEAADRHALIKRLDALQPLPPGKTPGADGVLAALQLEDQLDRTVARHTTYLELRYDSDTRQTDGRAAGGELNGLANRRFAAFNASLGSLSDADVARFERARPELRRYRYSIENARREQSHQLDDEGERILGTLGQLATGWGGSLFRTTMASTDFGSVRTATGDLSVARDYTAIATNPDPEVRRAGYLRNEAGLAEHRETYAAILTQAAEALNTVARLRHYDDYADKTYGARFLDRKQVLGLLNSLADAADINKRIEKRVVDHYRTTYGLDFVHVWDVFLPEPGITVPRFTIAQASQAVVDGTKPLGEHFTAEETKLLDPANGRLDIAPGPYRVNRPGGFSAGYVGFPSMFFQGTYNGYVYDVVVLGHESCHAVQNMLMDADGVLPRYASGPAYFTESFAGLCELLVLERMYHEAPDRAHKIFFLQQLITQGAEVFRAAWESLFEQQIFDSVASGKVLRADDLEAMTQQTASRFSIWFGPGSEKKLAWLQPNQFFTRPLYRVNYVYSKLLALRYFDLLHRDPDEFPRRYEALLRNGYDAPPDALLRQFVGVSLADPALIASATKVLESWLGELERLYKS